MLRLITILPILLTLSCATKTQIHIYSLGMEEEQVAHLSDLLSEKGFDARPNVLPVPGRIMRHTVIFPAIVQDFATIELVETVMGDAGYPDAKLILETEANHYYSTNNVGVYLVDPDFEGSAASLIQDPYALGGDDATRLTLNYFSECPEGSEAQSELNLYPSGLVLLEEFIWDTEDNREINIVHDGEWKSDNSKVEIEIYDGGALQFSIEEYEGSNWFGPYKGLSLRSQYSTMEIEHCDYTYLNYEDSNW